MKPLPDDDPCFKHLMALPVHHPDRPRLRDQIPITGSKLALRAKKFWHYCAEFSPQPIPLQDRLEWRYADWLRTCDHKHGTRQAPTLPFESGPNTLPGMEGFTDKEQPA